MAVTTKTAVNPLVTDIVTDSTANLTVETAASSNQNVYAVEIVNSNDVAVYVHVMNAATNSTTATQHDHQFYCAANTSCYYYFPLGYKTETGIQFFCSTTATGGQSAGAPTKTVNVKIGCTDR
jgi:hypothetical protein|tara:strand:+ start:889 stop:1257 length:369 start_codon:yes stop_codon:yes gene_type:complete